MGSENFRKRQQAFVKNIEVTEYEAPIQDVPVDFRNPGVHWLLNRDWRAGGSLIQSYLDKQALQVKFMGTSCILAAMVFPLVKGVVEMREDAERVARRRKNGSEEVVMPPWLLDKLATHTERRLLRFGNNAETLTNALEASALAKDLGKYACSLVVGWARKETAMRHAAIYARPAAHSQQHLRFKDDYDKKRGKILIGPIYYS